MFELGTDGPSIIVVGIDGSDSSMRAAAYAAGLARRQRSKLALVYIQPSGAISAPGAGAAVVDLGRDIAEDLQRQIVEATERLDEHERPSWEFISEPGDPYNGLMKVADRLKADAVVIGASQKAGHRILGSVAVRLVKAGRWPVTVVP
ncbi:MAG TPA: universal stress protein [Actinocrinis sp.]|jgi:nucleotide-binding universal stress UspA family protein